MQRAKVAAANIRANPTWMMCSQPLAAVTSRLDRLMGGPARRRVILTLACTLALDSADKATIGTSATQLESGLGIGKPQIGLLLAVSSLVGAAATIPAGMLADRVNRTRLLAGAVLCWAVAMILSGLATSFLFLLLTRLALGAVVAVAGPALASLIGDYFPVRERGRIYGLVLSGELVGAGVGFLISGQLAIVSWRAPFLFLAAPSLLVWWLLARLPEPERGGGSRLETSESKTEGKPESGASLPARVAREQSVQPRQAAVLPDHAERLNLRQAARYVLSVRTNVVLIVASALGYFFFSGLRGFAVQFAKHQYGVSQSVATSLTLVIGIGALLGVLTGGRLADHLLSRGRLPARVEVAGVAVLCACLLFVPALLSTTLAVALPALLFAALFLGMANPPLDAARLDVIRPPLWGRAEAIRSVLRSLGDAGAPLVVGLLAQDVFGGSSGLRYTFLVLLITLLAGAVITLLIGRRTYPADVAAVSATAQKQ